MTSLPRIPAEIHEALQGREFAEAVKLIDAAVAGKKVAAADYLVYLKGTAQIHAGELDAALDTFAALEKEFPKSDWVSRARFGRAAALSKQRNYQAAAAIYKAEAQRLLSSSRKDELTGIYLEFADRYFEGEPAQGPSARKQPDYNQALVFYTQALQLRPSVALRHKVELRSARCHQELNQLPQAIEAYRNYLKQWADKRTLAAERLAAPLDAEAQFQLGRAQLAAGQPAEARKTWQDFLTSDAAKEAGGQLIAEATYRMAHTYGVPQPATVGDLELGVAALEKFVKAFPKHELAPQAEFEMAQSYAHHGRFEPVVGTLRKLIDNPAYAKAPQVPAAWNLLGQSFASQKKFTEAIAAWREFLEKYASDPSWSNVQRVIIDTEYAVADELRTQENYDAARKGWETFLNKYPLDGRAPQILLLFGQMQFDAAMRLLPPLEGKRPAEGVKPDPEGAKKLFLAAIEDWQRLARLADSLEAYKKVEGAYQGEAQQRIANLTAKQLEIVTERKFRTNEKPRITLGTRNLENVTVKLYRIDLTDYFRKMHLATGVESLDIALIDPDKSWEQKIDNFEKYRRLDQTVEIPIEGPGVMAVTVSSDTLEATTMVVVSDIDIVVKSSRNELFVFAENMRTGKPAPGVTLLVSDGSKDFAEAVSGPDGVFQEKFEELKTVNDLRVFAVQEGHSASSRVSLEGLQFAVGLSPKGYLYTERPAYRAGQLVHLKGVIRWVADDRYTFKTGEKYQLDVYDARGRVLHTESVALGEFGTFATHFTLPGTAPQGAYRAHLHQPGRDQSYETSFLVHEYQLEPIQFLVDLPQKTFYRGEHVKGKLILKYYYGTPLAGRTVQYKLGDDRLYTAETDANGEVAFDLATQRYSESQPLTLTALYPERNLQTGETVFLATRGFQVAVSALRSVYLVRETFDASIAVTDPAGKPVGTALKLEVFEQTPAARGLPAGERLIQTLDAKSDEKTGQARQTIHIDKSGRYVVRATGTDRFGNSVSGATTLMISGDDDKVRLRILADKHQYKVGETGKVQLHWRDKPALALITFEGAEVLGYRLIELQTGANPLDLPLEEKLAPNFELAVTVMEGDKFHEARSEFRVTRDLVIGLKPSQTTLKPGEPLTVDVLVTDASGKPVSAEVSLALIQKNLLSMFPEQGAALDQFFNGGARQVSVRAMTSCVFRYAPPTRPINLFLLAEEDRKKILEQELKARHTVTLEKNMTFGATAAAIFDTEAAGIIVREDDNDMDGVYDGPVEGLTDFDGEASQPLIAGATAATGLGASDSKSANLWNGLTKSRRKWVAPGDAQLKAGKRAEGFGSAGGMG
ncbi:MAG: MG2 domain-containing protein, partial [Planctomycetales bacterium]